MSAAVLAEVAPAGSIRLLADVRSLGEQSLDERASAFVRLEEALGRDFADRLVTALSDFDEPGLGSPPSCGQRGPG